MLTQSVKGIIYLFQNCITFFRLWNIKGNILKNVGNQTVLVTTDSHIRTKRTTTTISHVSQKKEIHTGLEQHEGVSFFGVNHLFKPLLWVDQINVGAFCVFFFVNQSTRKPLGILENHNSRLTSANSVKWYKTSRGHSGKPNHLKVFIWIMNSVTCTDSSALHTAFPS